MRLWQDYMCVIPMTDINGVMLNATILYPNWSYNRFLSGEFLSPFHEVPLFNVAAGCLATTTFLHCLVLISERASFPVGSLKLSSYTIKEYQHAKNLKT